MSSPNQPSHANAVPPNGAPRPDADQIRQRMLHLRDDLQREVAGVSRGVQDAAHWQFYVKKFPFVCVGAAVVAGFALVPSRRPAAVVATDDQIKSLAEQGKLHVISDAPPQKEVGLSQKAALALGTMLAREGVAYLGKVISAQTRIND